MHPRRRAAIGADRVQQRGVVREPVKAADLPDGSVVADRHDAYIKITGAETYWSETGSRVQFGDSFIDRLLADGGDTILRRGYGD